MSSNPRARPLASSGIGGDSKRGKFIRDNVTVQLIQEPLSDEQWCDRLSDLKDKLRTEFNEMPQDIKVSKAFATLRGLCLGPKVVMSLSVSLSQFALFSTVTY